ncbi:MAG: thrombospondin type 3 repeat-containing protein, partial [Myxococcales bacterium]|nr:thrombospondin type 3 repeat-containing protein [Myxococcales bacterium]
TDRDGIGDACEPAADSDGYGVPDDEDRCPLDPDPSNADTDGDRVGDVCDNCTETVNNTQADVDQDHVGDACDRDCSANGNADCDTPHVCDIGVTDFCVECVDVVQCAPVGQFCDSNVCTAVAVNAVDFCRLQFPNGINAAAGTQHTIYGRVNEAGLTTLTTGTDPDDRIRAEFGFGPKSSNPDGNVAWTWFAAQPNLAYDGSPQGQNEPANDEYQYLFTLPNAPGNYDYAYRFSVDAGQTYTYCDRNQGSANGYDSSQAGNLTIQ